MNRNQAGVCAANSNAPARARQGVRSFNDHVCTFAPPSVWVRLIVRNGGVPRRFWPKLARILALSIAAAPLRLAETVASSRLLPRATLREPPLFVLGLARTGTTHLHNLLVQDPNHGCLTTFQAIAPTFSLVGDGWLKRLMQRRMGGAGVVRPVDNMAVALDAPQEEEIAVANSSHMSYVHMLSFPKLAERLFEQYAMMPDDGAASPWPLSEAEAKRWSHEYLRVVLKASAHAEGRRLVLKSPNNMGRVDRLLRLFPNAKFVHIRRDPYVVYASLMNMFRIVLPLYQLDEYDFDEMERLVAANCDRMLRKYVTDRARIPPGNLAEVRFEDLESNPVDELERLYRELGLPGWSEAEPRIREYLETLSGYRKNEFRRDQALVDRVNERWAFTVRAWGYPTDPKDAAEP